MRLELLQQERDTLRAPTLQHVVQRLEPFLHLDGFYVPSFVILSSIITHRHTLPFQARDASIHGLVLFLAGIASAQKGSVSSCHKLALPANAAVPFVLYRIVEADCQRRRPRPTRPSKDDECQGWRV